MGNFSLDQFFISFFFTIYPASWRAPLSVRQRINQSSHFEGAATKTGPGMSCQGHMWLEWSHDQCYGERRSKMAAFWFHDTGRNNSPSTRYSFRRFVKLILSMNNFLLYAFSCLKDSKR